MNINFPSLSIVWPPSDLISGVDKSAFGTQQSGHYRCPHLRGGLYEGFHCIIRFQMPHFVDLVLEVEDPSIVNVLPFVMIWEISVKTTSISI